MAGDWGETNHAIIGARHARLGGPYPPSCSIATIPPHANIAVPSQEIERVMPIDRVRPVLLAAGQRRITEFCLVAFRADARIRRGVRWSH